MREEIFFGNFVTSMILRQRLQCSSRWTLKNLEHSHRCSSFYLVADVRRQQFLEMCFCKSDPYQPGGSLFNIEHSNQGLITFPGGVPLITKGLAFISEQGCFSASRVQHLPRWETGRWNWGVWQHCGERQGCGTGQYSLINDKQTD